MAMNQVDRVKVKDIVIPMKDAIRKVIDEYAIKAAQLSLDSTDPHAPVLGFVQMALANAAVDYMVDCGSLPLEAFEVTLVTTGGAMEAWTSKVMELQGITIDKHGKAKRTRKSKLLGPSD
jgi:hypothetical protein